MKRAVLLTLLLFPITVYPFCFDLAGRLYGINPDLLRAIAVVESGMDQSKVSPTGDYGVMQINRKTWEPILGRERWRLVVQNPCYNVLVGAWILSQCVGRYGYTWDAVSCYHSGSGKRGKKYVVRVIRVLEGRRDENR